MTRKEAREFMMKVIFQMEANNDFDVNNKSEYFKGIITKPHTDYCDTIYSLICNKIQEIDEKLSANSINWKLSRMPKTDLAILRLAAAEILYMDDMPSPVAINEAVELSKVYGTDDSNKYVNAILKKIAQEN